MEKTTLVQDIEKRLTEKRLEKEAKKKRERDRERERDRDREREREKEKESKYSQKTVIVVINKPFLSNNNILVQKKREVM